MFGTTNTGFPGSTQFTNVSVTFSLQSTPDYVDYPYRATYSNSAITSNTFASVIYSGSQTSTGKYASFCSTFDGGVYLYATSNVGTIVVPTISIGMYSSGLNIDETVTPNSKALITSGAVASAIASTKGQNMSAQDFADNSGSIGNIQTNTIGMEVIDGICHVWVWGWDVNSSAVGQYGRILRSDKLPPKADYAPSVAYAISGAGLIAMIYVGTGTNTASQKCTLYGSFYRTGTIYAEMTYPVHPDWQP